jgi:hypothetical protein
LTTAILAALMLVAARAAAEEPAQGGVAVVYMADGSSLPLRSWSLSYEYMTWPQGGSQALAKTARRESRELWFGKRTVPAQGATLGIVYGETERAREEPGETRTVRIPLAREASVTAGGRASRFRLEPPHRTLLMPDGEKSLFVQPRSMDLRGETISGTRRELCLLTYTSQVECAGTPDVQVVKVEFQ